MQEQSSYTLVKVAKNKFLDLNLKEVWHFKDLLLDWCKHSDDVELLCF